jgi:type VI secretion system secreted protein Hcp
MPVPAYIDFQPEFEGSCDKAEREGMVKVIEFNHELHIPTDQSSGLPTGLRVHHGLNFVKNYDKSSPMLYQYLVDGKKVPEVKIHWWEIDTESGQEKEYFTHTLTNVIVVGVKPYMRNTDDPAFEKQKHMEEVSLRYEKIKWTFVDGNIEFEDDWKAAP